MGRRSNHKALPIRPVSVEQVSRAIDGVAQGAQEQASAVAKASSLTTQINELIIQVNQNAKKRKQKSEAAAASAERGRVRSRVR